MFMENYITSQRDQMFRNVEVLIYVFDVESREIEKDLQYYQSCIEAIVQHSRDAKIFCLVHKMDLVREQDRDAIFKERELDLKRRSLPLQMTAFRTSIWDETLYKAWSAIVYSLIPNVSTIEANLTRLCTLCDADEVALFERTTLLLISHACMKPQSDMHRFEKVSNVIKQFKLSCSKSQAQFQNIEIQSGNLSVFLQGLTSNTIIMVIQSDASIQPALTLMNISASKSHFSKII